ncbi:MAG TPA: GNAT family N-acetyltransferase [Hyphomicrobium sp.]|jgi:RimJ/RimL family protein N-acetyltransferase
MDPEHYLVNEVLKDGTPITVRAIRRDDKTRLLEAFKSLDRESVYRRFFTPKKELTKSDLQQLTEIDFSDVVALVVAIQTKDGETLIGGGRYATENAGSGQAEIAFMTDGNYRGLGIASVILSHLTRIARDAGVSRFEAEVLAENQPMLAVFRRSGLPMSLKRDGSVLHVTLSLQPDAKPQN